VHDRIITVVVVENGIGNKGYQVVENGSLHLATYQVGSWLTGYVCSATTV
jgi:hypothetical protein